MRRTAKSVWKRIWDVVTRNAAWLYSVLAIFPAATDLTPSFSYEFWDTFAWLCQDMSTIGLTGLAFVSIDYKRLELKALAFCLFIWRSIVLAINSFHADPVYSPYAIGALAVIFAYFIIRSNSLRDVLECDCEQDCAFYALAPVYSLQGIIQAIFLPWHMGRYESRVVFDHGNCWMIHRGRFESHKMNPKYAIKQGWKLIPIGRHLTSEEFSKLHGLTGKKSILGFRDCRKLMVAGNPKQYVK